MQEWYTQLIKPSWAPPTWLFGPVWTFLYIIIAITFGYVLVMFIKKRIPFKVLLPFLLNLLFNFSFTPVQFGLKNNILGAVVVLLTVLSLIWALIAIYPYKKIITYANIPYLLWGTFATCLQFTITYLNL